MADYSPSQPAPSPPGWYPDAYGQLRFWDGLRWTEHTTAPGPAQPGYPSYPSAGYPNQSYGYPPYALPTSGYGFAPVPGGRIAGMGSRFAGLLIDSLIVVVPILIIGISTGAYHSSTDCDSAGNNCIKSGTVSFSWQMDLLALVIGAVYSGLLVGLTGRTVGHRAAGIRVVDVNTGALIGFGRAAVRWVVMSVTGALLTIGYWSPFFDSARRQGWHDKAVRSVVVPAR